MRRNTESPHSGVVTCLACCLMAGLGLGLSRGVCAPDKVLTVYAASSLTQPFGDLCARFQASHPDVRVRASYAGTPVCNLGAYNFNGVANTDGLLPTASSTPGVAAGPLQSCFATLANGSLFDITGNLREITFRAAGDYPLMGGAFNTNAETGAQCDFSFYSVPNTFKFFDTGFRCCFTADPTL